MNINLKQDNLYSNGLFNNTNYNAYNIDLVSELLDVYMLLCDTYDKIINVAGFCRMTGITDETIYSWGRGGNGATPRSTAICKKLTSERERTLSDRLASGKVNPVGVIAYLNHCHGWAGIGNMHEDKTKQNISLADVRKNAALLSDNLSEDRNSQTEKMPDKLCDNSKQLETQ